MSLGNGRPRESHGTLESLSHTFTHSHTHSHSLSLSHTYTHSHSLSLTLSHTVDSVHQKWLELQPDHPVFVHEVHAMAGLQTVRAGSTVCM